MIRFHKSFLDPYYKESFYRDIKGKTFASAFAHLFVAALFAAFIASLLFYFLQKNKIEVFMLQAADTVSNEYPLQYKVSINKDAKLESNMTPVSFFDVNHSGQNGQSIISSKKLITVDSNQTIESAYTAKNHSAHYLFLRDGYMFTDSKETGSYKGFEGFSLSRSLVEIKLDQFRSLIPFIPGIITLLIFFAMLVVYPLHYLFVSLFIGGFLYLIFNFWFKEKLTYKEAYILAVFAGGTVLFIQLLFVGVGLPTFPLFAFVTGTLFVVLMHKNAEYFPVKTSKISSKIKEKLVSKAKNIRLSRAKSAK
jgi:hypothetical protein